MVCGEGAHPFLLTLMIAVEELYALADEAFQLFGSLLVRLGGLMTPIGRWNCSILLHARHRLRGFPLVAPPAAAFPHARRAVAAKLLLPEPALAPITCVCDIRGALCTKSGMLLPLCCQYLTCDTELRIRNTSKCGDGCRELRMMAQQAVLVSDQISRYDEIVGSFDPTCVCGAGPATDG